MNRSKELRQFRRLIDLSARPYERRFRERIVAVTEQALEVWKMTSEVPAIEPSAFEDLYRDLIQEVFVRFASRVNTSAKAVGLSLETKSFADLMKELALEFIRAELIRRRIVSISETTREQIMREVERGYEEGVGVEEIARRISQRTPTIARVRARVIARTETHTAANAGGIAAARATGLPMQKVWNSVEDHRTRDFGEGDGEVDSYNHRAMDGQTVGLDEPFLMPAFGGTFVEAQYPGDPALPPGASINCRCSVSYVASLSSLLGDD